MSEFGSTRNFQLRFRRTTVAPIHAGSSAATTLEAAL